MIVTKQQLVCGVARFACLDVLPAVGDKALQIIIAACATFMKQSQGVIDNLLNSGIAKMLLPEIDGGYDIGAALGALKSGISESGGGLPITIPPIPLISKNEQTLTFTARDIDVLSQRIQEVVNGQ